MGAQRHGDVTELRQAWSEGDKDALDELIPLVYAELRGLAHSYVRREHSGQKLQTTEVVNEAYVELVRQRHVRWQSRAHFFGIAAQIMRRILAQQARRRKAVKRGAGAEPISLDVVYVVKPIRTTAAASQERLPGVVPRPLILSPSCS